MRHIWALTALTIAIAALATDWPTFLGPNGNLTSNEVPTVLPGKNLLWSIDTKDAGYAPVAVSGGYAVVLDYADSKDYIICLDSSTGTKLWEITVSNEGELDYGNAPRACPLIYDNKLYVVTAPGKFLCYAFGKTKPKKPLWQIDLAAETSYNATMPEYGFSSSPTVADGKLIYNPGSYEASMVALDPNTGKEIWRSKGRGAAYASFTVDTLGGVKQIVTHDGAGLCGYELATGKLLWTVDPEQGGDFNVNTPIAVDGKLFVATDNNFARLYEFREEGKIRETPIAVSEDYAPDMATPVYYKGLIWGTSAAKGLVALDPKDELKVVWSSEDGGYDGFSGMVAGNDRILILDGMGKMHLIVPNGADTKDLGSVPLSGGGEVQVTVANGLLYARDTAKVYCYALK